MEIGKMMMGGGATVITEDEVTFSIIKSGTDAFGNEMNYLKMTFKHNYNDIKSFYLDMHIRTNPIIFNELDRLYKKPGDNHLYMVGNNGDDAEWYPTEPPSSSVIWSLTDSGFSLIRMLGGNNTSPLVPSVTINLILGTIK